MLIPIFKSKHSTVSGLIILYVYQKWRDWLRGGKRVRGRKLGMKNKVEEMELCVKLTFMGILKYIQSC